MSSRCLAPVRRESDALRTHTPLAGGLRPPGTTTTASCELSWKSSSLEEMTALLLVSAGLCRGLACGRAGALALDDVGEAGPHFDVASRSSFSETQRRVSRRPWSIVGRLPTKLLLKHFGDSHSELTSLHVAEVAGEVVLLSGSFLWSLAASLRAASERKSFSDFDELGAPHGDSALTCGSSRSFAEMLSLEPSPWFAWFSKSFSKNIARRGRSVVDMAEVGRDDGAEDGLEDLGDGTGRDRGAGTGEGDLEASLAGVEEPEAVASKSLEFRRSSRKLLLELSLSERRLLWLRFATTSVWSG